MFKRQSFKKLGKKASHRNAMTKNLLRSIFQSGYLTTTTPKAKMLKGEVESIIRTINKSEKDHNLFKKLEAILGSRNVVEMAINYVGSTDRKVRIVKVGFRPGDNAEKSKIELMGYKSEASKKKVTKGDDKAVAETKEVKKVEKKSGLRGLISGGKSVGKVATVKRERARSRSGL